MQFIAKTNNLTSDEYVAQEYWNCIKITKCLIHPDEDCCVAPNGTYPRLEPTEGQIARFLCKKYNITFSLLPDFYSSRLPGTLEEVELVVLLDEIAEEKCKESELPDTCDKSKIMYSAVEELGIDLDIYDIACNEIWLERRLDYVRNTLLVFISLFPELFGNCQPTITSFKLVMGKGPVLIRLREIAGPEVYNIPVPVGLNPCLSRATRPG